MMEGGTEPLVGGKGGIEGVAGGAKSVFKAGTEPAGVHADIPSIHTMVCGVSCPPATICLHISMLYGPYCWPPTARNKEIAGIVRGGGTGIPSTLGG